MLIKTRFAPSPTGYLHVGNLRTALYSYLYARKYNGISLLRVEDTDQERFVEGAIKGMLESMKWAGMSVDEGVCLNETGEVVQMGDKGSYVQSERTALYKKYADELIQKGHAYYCFCSKERLDEVRKFQELNKMPTGYDGHCRDLNLAEAQKRVDAKESFVIRMKMPREGATIFIDLIRGSVEFQNKLVDDQVLIKSDGFPTYHLAVVVDDHLMEITHVIRGEDWISSTPKHIKLYEMFGWVAPEFGHLPLLVNEQKQKLSKRHGDVSVEDFKAKGYLPQALVNFVAFLGWNPGTEQELFTLKELEQSFSLEKVSKSAAVFNREKLNWYNQQYIKKMSNEELARIAMPWFLQAGYLTENEIETGEQFTLLANAIGLEKERVSTLAELPAALAFIFQYNDIEIKNNPQFLVWKKSTSEETKKIIGELLSLFEMTTDWTKQNLDTALQNFIQVKNYGVGNVMWPLRVALSGQKNSPGPTEIAGVLGKQKTLARLSSAVEKL